MPHLRVRSFSFNRGEAEMTKAEIDRRFAYHAPEADQPPKYETIRAAAKSMAIILNELCPDSCERDIAITRIEEAMFWANASIARN